MSATVGLFARRTFALTLLLFATVGVASAAASRDSLVLSPAGLPGWHALPVSAGSARADLAVRASRSAVGRTSVQATAARRARLSLRSEAFLFPGSGSAARTVVAWGLASKARHVSLGQDGRATVVRLRQGAAEVIVVWREHARVGLLRLQAGRGDRGLLASALDYARLADTVLRTPLPPDRWGRVLEGIRADGSVSKQTALQAFTVAYGGLPGVRAPGGRRVAVQDGTGVIAWMHRYARALTPRQRAIVEARLGVRLGIGLPHAVIAAAYGDRSFRPDPAATRLAYTFVPMYETLTGHHLALPIVVGPSTEQTKVAATGSDAVMDASPVDNPGGQSVCRVRLLPARRAETSAYLRYSLAHEVFHCFQFDLAPTKWISDADWIIEGGAEWAAAVVDRVPEVEPFIDEYVQTPHRPLFTRTYDAIGFWGHAADISTEETIFANMGKILNAGSNVSAYGEAGGFTTQFLTDWGPSVFRQTAFTPEWTMRSPITPPDFFAMPPGDLGAITGHGDVSAAPYTTAQYIVQTHADVVHVAIEGPTEIYSRGLEYSDLSDAYFCTRQECSCPPGTEGQLPPLRPMFDQDYLGVTGDPGKGTRGSITSMSLDDFCHPKPKPGPALPPGGGGSPAGCASPCGSSNGDPHLETIAGYDYDFQASGEFTAVKSTTDDLEIQERQEPFSSRDVTINTAVAMSVAGDRVQIDAGGKLRVRVNGSDTGAHGPLPDGGSVVEQSGTIAVTWPDGSQAQVWPVGPWGVAYLFEPALARAGHLVGLLGSDDGDTRHLVTRDGHIYVASALEGASGFAAKYRHFGESWRITQATSLFTYAPGRNTGSFTDRSIPTRPRTARSLSARVRAAAAATCRTHGVTRPPIFRDCILDVGITRRAAFAASGATLERVAGMHAVPTPRPQTRATRFVATCGADAPPDANGQIPVGTDAGIEIELQSDADPSHPLQTDGPILIHWPEDGVADPVDSSSSDFHELDAPGIHTAYATFGGDANQDPTQSITCTWDVAG